MKFLLIQRLTCPIRRFSGFTGGEMNFHIVCGEATHGGKLCGVRAIDGWGNRKEPGTVYRSRLFSQRPYTAVRYTSANMFLAIRTSKFATCDFGGGEGSRTPVRKQFHGIFSGRRRLFLRAVSSLFPLRQASRHACRSGESHDAWHSQLFPYSRSPLNDALLKPRYS